MFEVTATCRWLVNRRNIRLGPDEIIWISYQTQYLMMGGQVINYNATLPFLQINVNQKI